MPIGVFQAVREVSSEDAVHVAANLLKDHSGKMKWKTQQTGEKSAYVILEFNEPQQITGIDIGNEHSAFIEVMVSRSGCQPNDFNALLLSSSFMTPIESKNSSNLNRVRCFNGEALCSTALPDKWKLVKIICTQPFNKHVQYGLSFIKIHVNGSPPAAVASNTVSASATPKTKSLVPEKFKHFGIFKMREESPDSESESQAALFQRWKSTKGEATASAATPTPKPATTAAAIRDASSGSGLRRLSQTRSSPLTVTPKPKAKASAAETKSETKTLDRNRESLLFGDDNDDDEDENTDKVPIEDPKLRRLSKHIEADKSRRENEKEKELENNKKNKTKRLSLEKSEAKVESIDAKAKAKPKESPSRAPKRLSSSLIDQTTKVLQPKSIKKQEIELQYRPFNQLLRGVVLVISGIQNPDRADLRSKAVALGAKYKADWESGCTHLICAFKNTPKYNQVRGKGKIVTRSWIEKCYALKKYLPWRRYALDTNDLGQPESDVELLDESMRPQTKLISQDDDNDDMDVEFVPQDKENITHNISSGIDTEDELERVAEENNRKKKQNEMKTESRDVYEVSTDEEDYLDEKKKQS
ncbi:LOW QUALITY PROTEIN: DNA repair protein XRCC1 [Drosophila tropicalis]|uniref:LOW QUALITY PROTEIN: DNA repair protein XRCC1 n=1 Tax=Drosophila tropicalis TaxID=46794 RepID=UPI0035ABE15B